MKNKLLLFVLLMLLLPATAMSGDSENEKMNKNEKITKDQKIDIEPRKLSEEGIRDILGNHPSLPPVRSKPISTITGTVDKTQELTQEELHNIATNYYMYMFSEEHEWKGMKRKDGEDIIKNIVAITSDSISISYLVNYNPDGHVMILGYKNLGTIIDQHGSGYMIYKDKDVTIDFLDKRLHPFIQSHLNDVRESIITNVPLITGSKIDWFKKLNVPISEFKDRHNFDSRTTKPDWWLKKKAQKILKE